MARDRRLGRLVRDQSQALTGEIVALVTTAVADRSRANVKGRASIVLGSIATVEAYEAITIK